MRSEKGAMLSGRPRASGVQDTRQDGRAEGGIEERLAESPSVRKRRLKERVAAAMAHRQTRYRSMHDHISKVNIDARQRASWIMPSTASACDGSSLPRILALEMS